MSIEWNRADRFISALFEQEGAEGVARRLSSRPEAPAPRFAGGPSIDARWLERRWRSLPDGVDRGTLEDDWTHAHAEAFVGNIEGFIGTVKVPVGIAGPLRVQGLFATGDYLVPLATTEAALVASYSRGAQLITRVGGCRSVLLSEGVQRAPGFAFRDLIDLGRFTSWLFEHFETVRETANATTRHGRLENMRVSVEGNHLYLILDFFTGDASGQNMVTIATEAVCQWLLENAPVTPEYSFVEANLSGDKKASAQSFQLVRGRKVTSEVEIPANLIEKVLHTSVERMVDYWRMSAMGGVLSGTLGVQGHFANVLAALYIATGQDAACVAESAAGTTRMEVTDSGDLYAAVTLPGIMVGTVGGGTALPSQAACLDVLGLRGPGNARALAELTGALCLAGELSIIGALCAGDFASAHQDLARGKSGS